MITCLILFHSANISYANVHIGEHAVSHSLHKSEHLFISDPLSELELDEMCLGDDAFLIPVDGRITSIYGRRVDPISGGIRFHGGIDIANVSGSKVVAAKDGVVRFSGWSGGCGRLVIIEHEGGFETRYCHLARSLAMSCERVERGQVIGQVGSTGRATGSHLHFEIRSDGAAVDPADYLVF